MTAQDDKAVIAKLHKINAKQFINSDSP